MVSRNFFSSFGGSLVFLGSVGRCVMAECIVYVVEFVYINKAWYGKLFAHCLEIDHLVVDLFFA